MRFSTKASPRPEENLRPRLLLRLLLPLRLTLRLPPPPKVMRQEPLKARNPWKRIRLSRLDRGPLKKRFPF
jgi:hypothetical protein